MAADQTLIAAAGKMGPAKVDYSGYMKAIGAVGKYINTKNSIAQGYINDRPDGIDLEELPKELLENEQNKQYFENSKIEYNKAVKIVRNQPAFTKKYKEAVKTMNDITKGFENVKNDLVRYADYREKNFVGYTSMSKQTNAADRLFQSDMIINNSDGFIDSKVLFSNDGISFGDVNINDFPTLQTNLVGLESAEDFNKIIENSVLDRERGRGCDSTRTRSDIQSKVDILLAKNGYNAVKSLAFDARFTDVNGNSESFMDVLSKELGVDEEIMKYHKSNPQATDSELRAMKDSMLAEAWQDGQNESLTKKLTEHLYELADNAHHNALDYSKGGEGTKTKSIRLGYNGRVSNWGRIDDNDPNGAYKEYVGWVSPESRDQNYTDLNNAFENNEPYVDIFGNTWTPTNVMKGVDNLSKKPTGFTITPLDRSEPVKTTEGKLTIRTLDQAINDLFGKAVPKQLP